MPLARALSAGPLFIAFLMIWSAGIIARGRNVAERGRVLNEQTIIATQLRNLVPLGLMLIILIFHIIELADERPLTQFINIAVSGSALLWLLIYLGGTVSQYCQSKVYGHPARLGLLEEARIKNVRVARRRFGICLTLYYFSGLITVANVFSDVYLLGISQSTRAFSRVVQLRQHLILSRVP
jgi:hypothetical protein